MKYFIRILHLLHYDIYQWPCNHRCPLFFTLLSSGTLLGCFRGNPCMKNQKKLSNEEINYSQPSQVLRYTFWWTTGRAVFNIHVLCVHCLTRLVMLVGKSSRVELDQMSLQWSHIEKFWSFLGYLAHPVSLHTWAHLCVCSWTLSLKVNGGGWLVGHHGQNAAFFDFTT